MRRSPACGLVRPFRRLGLASLLWGVGVFGCGGTETDREVNVPDEVFVVAGAPGAATGHADAPFADFQAAVAATSAAADFRGSFKVAEGRYAITQEVVLPLGARLELSPGATFAFAAGASLHAQGDVRAVGTEEAPIFFTWLVDGEPWGSLTNFEEGSVDNVFEWVIFEHGFETNFKGIAMRGALSLNGARARISHATFRNNAGDDGLNMKRSDSLVEYCTFENNSSDALDTDGDAQPEIAYSTFIGSLNDGIDLGEGTRAYVHHNTIVGSGDKGISAGEQAAPLIEHNVVVGNGIGLGVKDSANPMVRYNTLYGNDYGVRIFQEKVEFGGGGGHFESGIIWGSLTSDILYEVGTTTFAHSCIQRLNAGLGDASEISGQGLLSEEAGCPDPMFAGAESSDFHLRSTAGRWDEQIAQWTQDTETSPCIDTGSPSDAAVAEPAPNGARVNMGAYANTDQASKSPE